MYKKAFISVSVLAWLLWFGGCSLINSGDLEEPVSSSSLAENVDSSGSNSQVLQSSSLTFSSSSVSTELVSCESYDASAHFCDTRDGTIYKYVQIGDQVWMAENLRYLPSLNGIDTSSTEPKYYVYGYNGTDVSAAKATENYQTYGALYNWPAALKACPVGWHLPTDAEWTALEDYVGGSSTAGEKLKATSGWRDNGNGTDEYGFWALPGGYFYSGLFFSVSSGGYWWSASEYDASYAYLRGMVYSYDYMPSGYYSKGYGFSVRCVKD
ncbi:MAG: hypothetical protein GX801_05465 [Fibrobacter sp.]|nr:hypothetical protein [Fibrobacter sp.]